MIADPALQMSHVLVVDDDSLIRMDAVDILEEAGFDTLEASSGDEAVGILHAHHPKISLLFTDVHMPGSRDGFALARDVALRYPHIAIVVASGLASPRPGDMPDGALFISKPFSAKVVHQHLRRALPEHRRPHQLVKLLSR